MEFCCHKRFEPGSYRYYGCRNRTDLIVYSDNPVLGRPAGTVLDMPAAQKIAERYISDHNGPVAVNMSDGQYFPLGIPSDPVAGQYVFTFNRIVKIFPATMTVLSWVLIQ